MGRSLRCTCGSPDNRFSPRYFQRNWQNGRDLATFQGLNPGGAESAIGYTIPNLLIDHSMRESVPPGFWRGVNITKTPSI